MKRLIVFAVLLLAVTASTRAMAGDAYGAMKDGLPTTGIWTGKSCDPWVDYNCTLSKEQVRAYKAAVKNGAPCDPYMDYSCLDKYLGDDPVTRLVRYYELEWGKAVAPADPKAPPSSRPESMEPPTPQSVPPMPFTEWPYGGTQNIGKTIPNSIDSPLMVAIANTAAGKWLSDQHVQIYGWVDPAGNISTNTVKPAGNFPISYGYTPNTIDLDQAVIYMERVPDEVQNDHFDWGFRVSAIYGIDGRYTTAFGLFSNQFYGNKTNIFDMPMMYADLYFPIMHGLNVRIGRFISIPDIEAQLAPNNYTYYHSLTYTWDNYTNTGIEFTLALSKNWILQLGTTIGTEALPWHWGEQVSNLYVLSGSNAGGFGPGVDPLFPGKSMLKDPGAVPSLTTGIRWTSDDGHDDVNLVADAWNGGTMGYNNLQWIGGTYYHKLNDYWHISAESWNIHEYNVPNLNNPAVVNIISANGTPFSPVFMPFNGPFFAYCSGNTFAVSSRLTCTADEQTFLLYVNYSPNKLNNFSLRTEFFDDPQGQRTGTPTRYADAAFSWQHWFSPQVEVRPEIGYYRSLDAPAFNGNPAVPIPPTRDWAVIAASDIIWHF